MGINFSCGVDCSKVECASPGGVLKFRVLKDGKDALFVNNHEIDHDSLKVYVPITDTSSYNIAVQYDTSAQLIHLNLDQDVKYVLEISPFLKDTFEVFALPSGMDDCCKIYQLTSAKKNGQSFCQDGCNEIYEINL